MIGTIEMADAAGAALLVFTLRTPGGLVDSTRDIITPSSHAKTPVAVFVGPSGTRAASAGFLLTIAADVAAMAPGTHIGAAHPVTGTGEKIDETMAKKMAEDVAAYVRTLATPRHRNVDARRTGGEREPRVHRGGGDQRLAAADRPRGHGHSRPAARSSMAGRSRRFDGRTVDVAHRRAPRRPDRHDLRQRVLSAIAHPHVAYLLLSLGTLGLTIELWSPGASCRASPAASACCWRSSRCRSCR